MYSENTVKDYLTKLASREPVPGGGSAAALVGAAGAALLSKAANFTIGKEKYKAIEKEIKDILDRAELLRGNFLKLCSEDARAYQKLAEAFKLPKGEERDKRLESALKEAMAVPFNVCKSACEAIKLCAPLAEKGNKNLLSDVECAGQMLKCAYLAALLNVEINLKSIEDAKFVSDTRKMLESMKVNIK